MQITLFSLVGLLLGVVIGKSLRLQGVILGVYVVIGFYILLNLPMGMMQPLGSALYPWVSIRAAHLLTAMLIILAFGLVLLLIGRPLLAHLRSIPDRLDIVLGASTGGVLGFYITGFFEGVIW